MQPSDLSQSQAEGRNSIESESGGREDLTKRKSRSASFSSSTSISTISTRRSGSSRDANIRRRSSSEQDLLKKHRSRSRSLEHRHRSPPSKRSLSPIRSNMGHGQRRYRSNSPAHKRRRRESSNDDFGGLRPASSLRYQNKDDNQVRRQRASQATREDSKPTRDSRTNPRNRERSLSPYSRRLALTQAMNARK